MRLLLLLLSISTALAQQRPAARFDIALHCTNVTEAVALQTAFNSRFVISRTNDLRNINLLIRTNTPGGFNVYATFVATDTNAAETVWTQIQNVNKPANTSGIITVHQCPIDGDARFRDWSGCADDRRASYREIRW